MTIRLRGVAIGLITSFLGAAATVPAEASAPTRLWYSAKVTYKYDGVYDETRVDRLGNVHETSNVEWQVHTDRGEAPLVRRSRRTGQIGVATTSGANVVGKVKRTDWSHTVSWDSTVANCSPLSYTARSHLTTNPEISGLIQISGGSLNALLSAFPHAQVADETGTITCQKWCPFALPGSGRAPVEHADGSCHFDPGPPSEGSNAQWQFPSRNDVAMRNQLQPQHEANFQIERGFGKRRLSVASTAKAVFESTLSDPARTTKETATETITLDFTRCPGAGRRPC